MTFTKFATNALNLIVTPASNAGGRFSQLDEHRCWMFVRQAAAWIFTSQCDGSHAQGSCDAVCQIPEFMPVEGLDNRIEITA